MSLNRDQGINKEDNKKWDDAAIEAGMTAIGIGYEEIENFLIRVGEKQIANIFYALNVGKTFANILIEENQNLRSAFIRTLFEVPLSLSWYYDLPLQVTANLAKWYTEQCEADKTVFIRQEAWDKFGDDENFFALNPEFFENTTLIESYGYTKVLQWVANLPKTLGKYTADKFEEGSTATSPLTDGQFPVPVGSEGAAECSPNPTDIEKNENQQDNPRLDIQFGLSSHNDFPRDWSLTSCQFEKMDDFHHQASINLVLPPRKASCANYNVEIEYIQNQIKNNLTNMVEGYSPSSAQTSPIHSSSTSSNPNEEQNKKTSISMRECMEIDNFIFGSESKENNDTLATIKLKSGANIAFELTAGTGIATCVRIAATFEFGSEGIVLSGLGYESAEIFALQVMSALPYLLAATAIIAGATFLYKEYHEQKVERIENHINRQFSQTQQEITALNKFLQGAIPNLFALLDNQSNQFKDNYTQVQNEFKKLLHNLNHRITYAYNHNAFGAFDELVQVKQNIKQDQMIIANNAKDRKLLASIREDVRNKKQDHNHVQLIAELNELRTCLNTKEKEYIAFVLRELILEKAAETGNLTHVISENEFLIQPQVGTYIELPVSPPKPDLIRARKIAGEHGVRKKTAKNADGNVDDLSQVYDHYKNLLEAGKNFSEIVQAKKEFDTLLKFTQDKLKKIKLKKGGKFKTAFEYYEATINGWEQNVQSSFNELASETPAQGKPSGYHPQSAYDIPALGHLRYLHNIKNDFIQSHKDKSAEDLAQLAASMTSMSIYTNEDLAKIGGLPSLILKKIYELTLLRKTDEAKKLWEQVNNCSYFLPGNVAKLQFGKDFEDAALDYQQSIDSCGANILARANLSREQGEFRYIYDPFNEINKNIDVINVLISAGDNPTATIDELLKKITVVLNNWSGHKERRNGYGGFSLLPDITKVIPFCDISVQEWDVYIKGLTDLQASLIKEKANFKEGNQPHKLSLPPGVDDCLAHLKEHANDGPEYWISQIKEANAALEVDPNKFEDILKLAFSDNVVMQNIYDLVMDEKSDTAKEIAAKYGKEATPEQASNAELLANSLISFEKHIKNKASVEVWLKELKTFLTGKDEDSFSKIIQHDFLKKKIIKSIHADILNHQFGMAKSNIIEFIETDFSEAERFKKLLWHMEQADSSPDQSLNFWLHKLDEVNAKKNLDNNNLTDFYDEKSVYIGKAQNVISRKKADLGYYREAAEDLKELQSKATEFIPDDQINVFILMYQGQIIDALARPIIDIAHNFVSEMEPSVLKNVLDEFLQGLGLVQMAVPNAPTLGILGVKSIIEKCYFNRDMCLFNNHFWNVLQQSGNDLVTLTPTNVGINDINICLPKPNLTNFTGRMFWSQVGLKLIQSIPLEQYASPSSRKELAKYKNMGLRAGHFLVRALYTRNAIQQLDKILKETLYEGKKLAISTPSLVATLTKNAINIIWWWYHRGKALRGENLEHLLWHIRKEFLDAGIDSVSIAITLSWITSGWGLLPYLVAAAGVAGYTSYMGLCGTTKKRLAVEVLKGIIGNFDYHHDYHHNIKLLDDYAMQCTYRLILGIPSAEQLNDVERRSEILLAKDNDDYYLYYFKDGETDSHEKKKITANKVFLATLNWPKNTASTGEKLKEEHKWEVIKITQNYLITTNLIPDYINQCKYHVKFSAPTESELREIKNGNLILFTKETDKEFLFEIIEKNVNPVFPVPKNKEGEITYRSFKASTKEYIYFKSRDDKGYEKCALPTTQVIFQNPGLIDVTDDYRYYEATNYAARFATNEFMLISLRNIDTLLSSAFGGLIYNDIYDKKFPEANSACIVHLVYRVRRALELNDYDEVLKLTKKYKDGVHSVTINKEYRIPPYLVWKMIYYRLQVLTYSKINLQRFGNKFQKYDALIYQSILSDGASKEWCEDNLNDIHQSWTMIIKSALIQSVYAATHARSCRERKIYLSNISRSYNGFVHKNAELMNTQTKFLTAYNFYLVDDMENADKFLKAISSADFEKLMIENNNYVRIALDMLEVLEDEERYNLLLTLARAKPLITDEHINAHTLNLLSKKSYLNAMVFLNGINDSPDKRRLHCMVVIKALKALLLESSKDEDYWWDLYVIIVQYIDYIVGKDGNSGWAYLLLKICANNLQTFFLSSEDQKITSEMIRDTKIVRSYHPEFFSFQSLSMDEKVKKLIEKGIEEVSQCMLDEVNKSLANTQSKLAQQQTPAQPKTITISAENRQDKILQPKKTSHKIYYSVANKMKLTFVEIKIPGTGWSALLAAGITDPVKTLNQLKQWLHYEKIIALIRQALETNNVKKFIARITQLKKTIDGRKMTDAFLKHINTYGDPHKFIEVYQQIVMLIRQALENNWEAQKLAETFGLCCDNEKQLIAEITQLKNMIDGDNIVSGSLEHINAYRNFHKLLERSDVQIAYIDYLLQSGYADQNIAAACLHLQEKRLATYRVGKNDLTLFADFSDDLTPTAENVICIILDPGRIQWGAHYNRLKIIKVEAIISPDPTLGTFKSIPVNSRNYADIPAILERSVRWHEKALEIIVSIKNSYEIAWSAKNNYKNAIQKLKREFINKFICSNLVYTVDGKHLTFDEAAHSYANGKQIQREKIYVEGNKQFFKHHDYIQLDQVTKKRINEYKIAGEELTKAKYALIRVVKNYSSISKDYSIDFSARERYKSTIESYRKNFQWYVDHHFNLKVNGEIVTAREAALSYADGMEVRCQAGKERWSEFERHVYLLDDDTKTMIDADKAIAEIFEMKLPLIEKEPLKEKIQHFENSQSVSFYPGQFFNTGIRSDSNSRSYEEKGKEKTREEGAHLRQKK